jgi:quercetin dioxygenase-like cupin family protein
MFRSSRIVALSTAIVLMLSVGAFAGVRAQDGTPTTKPLITSVTLGTGMPSDAPGKAILLLRVTIQPGGAFPPHIHPGALVIAVESGDFTFSVLDGEADLTRAVASGTPEPTAKLTTGQDVVAHAGDEIFEQAGVVHTARNAGNTPVVVLVAGLVDPTQPFLQPMDMGTPAS